MQDFLDELKRRNVLRVAIAYLVLAWLLVQVGSVLLPTFEAPAWVMRVLVLVLAAGFVVTLVFSWVFELTPDGVKRESEIDRSQSVTTQTARKLDVAVIVLLIAAIGVAVASRGGRLKDTPAAVAVETKRDVRPSVAVLPFVNMSALKENEYFADGLSETLLNMLAQVSGLKVAARTSAFAFKDTKTDIREIGRVLNVSTVLEGSVQRAGTRVRITAQLIDVADGSHLWSQSYDRTLEDIFAIQDEIATAVAKELTRSLMGAAESRKPNVASPATHDSKAYDSYLRGLEQLNINSYASLPMAERLFQQSLTTDAGFDEARTALARTFFQMADTGLLTQRDAHVRGRAVLAPLIERKPPDPVALSYDAILRLRAVYDTVDEHEARRHARDTLQRAISAVPNAVELYEIAALTFRGDEKKAGEALALIERALLIDPLSMSLLAAKARQLREMKRFDESLEAFARVRELAPTSPVGYNGAALVYSQSGPYVEAVRWYARSAQVDRDDHELPAAAAQYLLVMGLPDEALPWIRRAEQLNASGSDSLRVRMLHSAHTGDRKQALQIAETVIRERRDNRRWIQGTAVIAYLTLMQEAGKLADGIALLRSEAPGVLDMPPKQPASVFDFIVLWFGTEFLADTFGDDERRARLAHFIAATKALDPEFNPDEGLDGVLPNALRGNHSRAAELWAQVLGDPGELPEEWRLALRSPLLAQAVKDPRVVAATAALEADFAKQAIRYRELVASGEIVVP